MDTASSAPAISSASRFFLMFLELLYPSAISIAAISASCMCGIPGTTASAARSPPVAIRACGCARNCFVTSVFRLPSETALVTIMPVETDIRSAGICDTRPSPMVAIEYI